MCHLIRFHCGPKHYHSRNVNVIVYESSKLFSFITLRTQLGRKSYRITTCKVTDVFQFHFCKEKGAKANCEVQRTGTGDRNVEKFIIIAFKSTRGENFFREKEKKKFIHSWRGKILQTYIFVAQYKKSIHGHNYILLIQVKFSTVSGAISIRYWQFAMRTLHFLWFIWLKKNKDKHPHYPVL